MFTRIETFYRVSRINPSNHHNSHRLSRERQNKKGRFIGRGQSDANGAFMKCLCADFKTRRRNNEHRTFITTAKNDDTASTAYITLLTQIRWLKHQTARYIVSFIIWRSLLTSGAHDSSLISVCERQNSKNLSSNSDSQQQITSITQYWLIQRTSRGLHGERRHDYLSVMRTWTSSRNFRLKCKSANRILHSNGSSNRQALYIQRHYYYYLNCRRHVAENERNDTKKNCRR